MGKNKRSHIENTNKNRGKSGHLGGGIRGGEEGSPLALVRSPWDSSRTLPPWTGVRRGEVNSCWHEGTRPLARALNRKGSGR